MPRKKTDLDRAIVRGTRKLQARAAQIRALVVKPVRQSDALSQFHPRVSAMTPDPTDAVARLEGWLRATFAREARLNVCINNKADATLFGPGVRGLTKGFGNSLSAAIHSALDQAEGRGKKEKGHAVET